jgi:hypothetical protein
MEGKIKVKEKEAWSAEQGAWRKDQTPKRPQRSCPADFDF